jgi:hypothetical protein
MRRRRLTPLRDPLRLPHDLPRLQPISIEQGEACKDKSRKAPLWIPGPYQLRKERCFKRETINEEAPAHG